MFNPSEPPRSNVHAQYNSTGGAGFAPGPASRYVYISDPNGYGVELLYELPREMWERDIDAGLNYLEFLLTEGDAALKDDLENAPRFGARSK